MVRSCQYSIQIITTERYHFLEMIHEGLIDLEATYQRGMCTPMTALFMELTEVRCRLASDQADWFDRFDFSKFLYSSLGFCCHKR
jgi:hypothetical protein